MAFPYDRENMALTFGWERPVVTTCGSSAVTATTIPDVGSGLTTNELAGQMLRVLSGDQKGEIYWIVSNTSTDIVVQGNHTPTDTTLGSIANTDRLAYSTNGVGSLSTCTLWPGIINGFTPPTREQTVESYYAHGSGVVRQISFVTQINYTGGSLPVLFQGRPELLLALGKVAITGTDKAGGGGSTLNGSVMAWDNQIIVDSAANYAADDYIQVSTGTSAEVRKITNVNGTTITLDHPLDYSHDDGATCNEVEAPWTYTIWPSTPVNRSFSLVRVMSDPEGDQNPYIQFIKGCYVDSADFSSSEDQPFMGTLGIVAMDDTTDIEGTLTAPVGSSAGQTENPYYWDNSAIQYNSVDIAIVRELNLNWNWNLEAIRCHGPNRSGDPKPYRFFRKYPSFGGSLKYIPVNTTLLTYAYDSTERDGYVTLTRSATDYIKLSWADTVVSTDKWPSPESGYVTAENTLSPEYISIEVKLDDTHPFY